MVGVSWVPPFPFSIFNSKGTNLFSALLLLHTLLELSPPQRYTNFSAKRFIMNFEFARRILILLNNKNEFMRRHVMLVWFLRSYSTADEGKETSFPISSLKELFYWTSGFSISVGCICLYFPLTFFNLDAFYSINDSLGNFI